MRVNNECDDHSFIIISLTIAGYYESAFDKKLPDECRCSLSGCEFDYSSNTYRLQVQISDISVIRINSGHHQAVLNAKTLDFATHYLVVKLDYGEGIPKLCSIR